VEEKYAQWLLFAMRAEKVRMVRGRNGYARGWILKPSGKLFSGSQNGRMGASVVLSGSDLQTFRERWPGWDRHYTRLLASVMKNVSRIDVAVDIHSNDFSVQRVLDAARRQSIQTRLSFSTAISNLQSTQTLYFGKRGSGRRIVRVYDKNAEQSIENAPVNWTRVEMQVGRGSRNVIKQINRGDDLRAIVKKYWHIQADDAWSEAMDVPASKGVHVKEPEPDTFDWLLSSAAPALGRYLADCEKDAESELSRDSVLQSFFDRVHDVYMQRLNEYS
jgi:hypothetical protein